MNLVFEEYCKFLEDKTGLKLEEGYYWLDNSIIKCFDKSGKIHKLYRIIIDDKLNVKIKVPKKGYSKLENIDIESWNDTVERYKSRLDALENDAKELIKSTIERYRFHTPIILTSGGKDSSVCMHLVRSVKADTKAIFNNTTLDCADTYKHIKEIDNVQTINPDEGFYQWRKRLNFIPTRFSRACCTIFKEGAMTEKLNSDDKYIFFMGMRNDESATRSGYEDEWHNEKWSENWDAILPIRKWTELDIWLYIIYRQISVNPKYRKGYARAGCAIACPFATKSTWVLDEYFYKYMYDRWHKILEDDFISEGKWVNMNCTLEEYHTAWNGGMVRDESTDEVVQEFMEYKDISDRKIAEKYFNNTCHICGKKVKKDEVALSMKYFGRQNEKMMCWKCLGKELDKSRADLKADVEMFKSQGCTLF